MIDGVALLPITLEQPNADGINLFGRRFGNYPQDLVMRIACEFPAEAAGTSRK